MVKPKIVSDIANGAKGGYASIESSMVDNPLKELKVAEIPVAVIESP
jgi:hypothetical protein